MGCRVDGETAGRALGPRRPVALLVLVLVACAPGSGPCTLPGVEGRVVTGDGTPIAGATVVEWWHGTGIPGAPAPVRHVRFAETDVAGRFSFPDDVACSPRLALAKRYGPTYGFAHPAYGLLRGIEPAPPGEPLVLRLAPEQAVAARAAYASLCETPPGDDATRALARRVCATRPARSR